jgi:hypothetical protein
MALTRRIYRPLPPQGIPATGKVPERDPLHLLRRERQDHGLDLSGTRVSSAFWPGPVCSLAPTTGLS